MNTYSDDGLYENITLDLNGHTIKRIVQSNGDGAEVIQIKNGGSLTLGLSL